MPYLTFDTLAKQNNLFGMAEAAKLCNVSIRTFYRHYHTHKLTPPATRIGKRVAWSFNQLPMLLEHFRQ